MATREKKTEAEAEAPVEISKVKVAFTSAYKPAVKVGATESHWGVVFTLVDEDGRFEALVSPEVAASLVEGNRAQIVES